MKFNEMMKKIEAFLQETPKDIFDFSGEIEDALVDDYDEMFSEQPDAVRCLSEEVPDICASAEPGMSQSEIEIFKRKLSVEYEKAKKLVI